MATSRLRSGRWEFTIKCKAVREKPFYFTFDTKEEGERYCANLESLLRQGMVPPELVEANREFVTVSDVIAAYMKARAVPGEDRALLKVTSSRIGTTKLSVVNYVWVEKWIQDMKVINNLSPSTIRHYSGALARCFDWGSNRGIPELAVNPMRLLARGYATYNDHDRMLLGDKGHTRLDVERDRRLESSEERIIRGVMGGDKPESKQRPLTMIWRGAVECLFDVALETAMRMRETYTLTLSQINFDAQTIFLDKTKNGDKRQVPMSSVAIRALRTYIEQVKTQSRGMSGFSFEGDRLFPWWNGAFSKPTLQKTTTLLSKQYGRIFAASGCDDFRFHDLRHEATSRLFEKTDLSDVEIMKVTGHHSAKMLLRYANIRGSNLASRLW
jgi:integrase